MESESNARKQRIGSWFLMSGRWGKQGHVGQGLQGYRIYKCRLLIYSMMTVFHNTILNTGNLLKG